jgi:hypothetical protein
MSALSGRQWYFAHPYGVTAYETKNNGQINEAFEAGYPAAMVEHRVTTGARMGQFDWHETIFQDMRVHNLSTNKEYKLHSSLPQPTQVITHPQVSMKLTLPTATASTPILKHPQVSMKLILPTTTTTSTPMIEFKNTSVVQFVKGKNKSVLLDEGCLAYKLIRSFQQMVDAKYILTERTPPHIELTSSGLEGESTKTLMVQQAELYIRSLSNPLHRNNWKFLNNAFVIDLNKKYHITIMYGHNQNILLQKDTLLSALHL